MKTALYRYYANDELLYVGISNHLPRRVREHARDAWWEQTTRIDVEWHPTREAALSAERQTIADEDPAHNAYHRPVAEQRLTPHEQVKGKLAKRGTDIGRFIEGGQMMGDSFEKIHSDLVAMTGVRFSQRTLYRWANREMTS